MNQKNFFMISILLVFLAGCTFGTPPKKGVQSSLSPEEIYANNCAACHGGRLEGGMGPTLKKVGDKMDKDRLATILKEGKGNMPAQSYLSEEDRDKLVIWLSKQK
jgi:cytochrome c551